MRLKIYTYTNKCMINVNKQIYHELWTVLETLELSGSWIPGLGSCAEWSGSWPNLKLFFNDTDIKLFPKILIYDFVSSFERIFLKFEFKSFVLILGVVRFLTNLKFQGGQERSILVRNMTWVVRDLTWLSRTWPRWSGTWPFQGF